MECRQWIVLIEELDPFLEGDRLKAHEEKKSPEGRGIQCPLVHLRLTWRSGVSRDEFVWCDDVPIRL